MSAVSNFSLVSIGGLAVVAIVAVAIVLVFAAGRRG